MGRSTLFSRPWVRIAVLTAAALALQGIGALYARISGDGGVVLYLLHLYAALPLCAVWIPFWCGLSNAHPFAACFPIGLALLLLPVYESPGMALLCVVLSLIGCVAGQEWAKRKQIQKGKHHGGKRKI
ncbi:MAG: hypothetical protein IJ662_07730 [Clostridia bacterium]|nr:hypothetical protein [Clostridia bacterium]